MTAALPQPYRTPAAHTAAGVIVATSRAAALAQLQRMQRQGRVAAAGQLHLMTRGENAGRYVIDVSLIPMVPAPGWAVKCRAVGAVLAGLAALLLAVRWLLVSLSAVSLAVLCTAVLVAFLGWLRFRFGGRRSSVRVNVGVHVR